MYPNIIQQMLLDLEMCLTQAFQYSVLIKDKNFKNLKKKKKGIMK